MQKVLEIIEEVKKAVVGKNAVVGKMLMVILAQGHILLEDIPGVGKTTLALAFSKAMALDYRRMQFTPDVMPTDVTGFSVYNKATGQLEYKPGAALCNLFLADEINRTSSKTQAALLEVMEEGRITVDGVTRETPKPYTVIATQNPVGSAGTQLLPESQMDRFMVCLRMGYPKLEDEVEIRLLGKAISKLSPREQTIIKLRFGLGRHEGREKTQKEVADLLGISQSYISRLEKRIILRLRGEMAKME